MAFKEQVTNESESNVFVPELQLVWTHDLSDIPHLALPPNEYYTTSNQHQYVHINNNVEETYDESDNLELEDLNEAVDEQWYEDMEMMVSVILFDEKEDPNAEKNKNVRVKRKNKAKQKPPIRKIKSPKMTKKEHKNILERTFKTMI